jgi:CRP-like cAMP-binding protein
MALSSLVKLNPKEISTIGDQWPPQIFIRETPLFYAGQVPNLAFLLLEGEIKVSNDKPTLRPSSLIGLTNLLDNLPSQITAIISPNSRACLIDRETFNELLEKNGPHSEILLGLLKKIHK